MRIRYLVCLLVLLSLSACATSRPESTQNRDVAEGFGQFMHRARQTAQAAQAYHTANRTWPESFEVLRIFASEHGYDIQAFASDENPHIDTHVINLREDAMDIGLELEQFGKQFSGIATIYAEGHSEERLAYIELKYSPPTRHQIGDEVVITLGIVLSDKEPFFEITPSSQQ